MKLILYHIESTGTDPAANRPCALAALALDASTWSRSTPSSNPACACLPGTCRIREHCWPTADT